MPIRVDDTGKATEAFYPASWIRLGKTGQRELPPVEHNLGGWEDNDELRIFFMFMVTLAQKHFRSTGIGADGVQMMLNWQWLVCRRLGMDTGILVVDAQVKRNKTLVPQEVTQEEHLAVRHVCEATEAWYKGEHGNEVEHRACVNAMTLSFRL